MCIKFIYFSFLFTQEPIVKPAQLVESKYLTPTLLMVALPGDAGSAG